MAAIEYINLRKVIMGQFFFRACVCIFLLMTTALSADNIPLIFKGVINDRLVEYKLPDFFLLPQARYDIAAQVRLNSSEITEVTQEQLLSFSSNASIKDKQAYLATLYSINSRLSVNFKPVQEKVALNNYDALWTDIETPDASACHFAIELSGYHVDVKKTMAKKIISADLSSGNLVTSFKNRTYLPPKVGDFKYYIKRVAAIGADKHWHLFNGPGYTTLKQRMHVPLKQVYIVDVFFPEQYQVLGGHLRLGKDGLVRSSLKLAWDTIPKLVKVDRKGTAIRLFLEISPSLISPEKYDEYFVTELAITLQDHAKLATHRPLNSYVTFKEFAGGGPLIDRAQIVPLSYEIKKTAKNNIRLVMNFSGFEDKYWQNKLYFSSGKLLVEAAGRKYACVAKPVSFRLISLGKKIEPIQNQQAVEHSQALGGPFVKIANETSQLEWISTDARLDFANVYDSHRNMLAKWGIEIRQKKAKNWINPLVLKTPAGISISNRTTRLVWDHMVELHPDSYLFFKMPVGASSIDHPRMDLQFSDGQTKTLPFMVNKPVLLSNSDAQIKTLKSIHFYFDTKAEKLHPIHIESIHIFHPVQLKKENAIYAAAPKPEWMHLQVPYILSAGKNITAKKNFITGSIMAGDPYTVSWRNAVNKVSRGLAAVKLTYHVNSPFAKQCWLKIVVTGEKHVASQTICPGLNTSVVESLNLDNFAPDEKVLYIDWEAQLDPADASLAVFYFEPYLLMNQSRSLADMLRNALSLEVNHQKLLPNNLTTEKMARLQGGNAVWLHYGSVELAGINEFIWRDTANKLIDVNKISLQTSKKLSIAKIHFELVFIIFVICIFIVRKRIFQMFAYCKIRYTVMYAHVPMFLKLWVTFFWVFLTAALYAIGLRIPDTDESFYCFDVAIFSSIFLWRVAIKAMQNKWSRNSFVALLEGCNVYFIAALINLLLVMLFVNCGSYVVAEQLTALEYALLLIGLLTELYKLYCKE